MKCMCKLCQVRSPVITEIHNALPLDLRDKFRSLVIELEGAESDRDFYRALWKGEWPGSEWIIEEKKKRNIK